MVAVIVGGSGVLLVAGAPLLAVSRWRRRARPVVAAAGVLVLGGAILGVAGERRYDRCASSGLNDLVEIRRVGADRVGIFSAEHPCDGHRTLGVRDPF